MKKNLTTCITAIAVVAMVLALVTPAGATFPGKNGRIAFIEVTDVGTSQNIFTMNPDGSDVQQLTFLGPNNFASWQSWSADGKQIVFAEYLAPDYLGQLWIMNADGSNQHLLLSEPDHSADQPSFSPDGRQVVFTRYQLIENGESAIYRVGVDGNDLAAITSFQPGLYDRYAKYSPDGRTIAFHTFNREGVLGAIYLMNANGSKIRPLTPPEPGAIRPDWSPDGEKIAFETHCCNPQNQEIWLMKADGTGLHALTHNNENWQGYDSAPHDFFSSWSPQGNAIVFERDSPLFDSSAILVINRDGSGQRVLHESSGRRAAKLPLSRVEAARKQGMGHHLKVIDEGGFFPRWGPASN